MPPRSLQPPSLAELKERGRALQAALDVILSRRALSRDELDTLQSQLLVEILRYAYEHVPFYRQKYDAAGFDPKQFTGCDDLQQIPLLTKQELRLAELSQLKSGNYPATVRLLSSSGSTGVPGRLYRDEDSLALFAAQGMAEYYQWCDGRPLENVLYVVDLSPDSIDAAMAEWLLATVDPSRILDAMLPAEQIVAKIAQFKPDFISAYPTALRAAAMLLERRRQCIASVKLLHTTAEMLDRSARNLFARVFPQARIVETYTSTEAGLIAAPCAAEYRWHLAEETAIYEIVDDAGQPTDDVGQLVVTNLTNWATPLIRYAGLGDFCRWDHAPCGCGSAMRSIGQLAGRVAQTLTLPDGRCIAPYVLINALEELSGVDQFQIVQQAGGELEILLVAAPGCSDPLSLIGRAEQTVRAALSLEVPCAARIVPAISAKAGANKTPLVVSHVDHAAATSHQVAVVSVT